MAETRNNVWITHCQKAILSDKLLILMNVLSKWIDDIPINAIASLTFMMFGFEWLCH